MSDPAQLHAPLINIDNAAKAGAGDEELGGFAGDLDFQLDASPEAPAEAQVPDQSLDFDLGFDAPAAEAATSAPEHVPLPDFDIGALDTPLPPSASADSHSEPHDAGGMDFDLGDMSLDGPVAEPAPKEAGDAGILSLDIPLDLGGELHADAPAASAGVTHEHEEPVFELPPVADDFDLDLGSNPMASVGEVSGADSHAITELDSPDLAADLDFDFELNDSGSKSSAKAPALDMSALSLDLDVAPAPAEAGDVMDFGVELDDPVTTKIDLARAYIDMGDKEGAREILHEAVAEGNADQKASAESLLAQL
jgi:pilus assembly protein FimV